MSTDTLQLRCDPGAIGDLTLEAMPGVDGRLRVRLHAGPDGFTGSCSLVLPLAANDSVPWFLLPGFFYGQGRDDDRLAYPAWNEHDAVDDWRSHTWDFCLDRAAFPVLLARQGEQWSGFDWDPHYRIREVDGEALISGPATWGDSEPQIGCGFHWRDQSGELRLNFPANDRPRRHARNPNDSATQRKLWLGAGQIIEWG